MTANAPQLPPEHRRRWLIRTVIAVVVTVALVVGGPWFYARVLAPDAEAPLALTTPTPTAIGVPVEEGPPAEIDVDGTWQVGPGSEAGYRLNELLSGQQVTATGRTEQVTGTVLVAAGMLSQAQVVVETGSIETDESARDAYFRRALDTSTYPQATFDLVEPIDVAGLGTAEGPVAVTVVGALSFHGVSQSVVAELQVQRTADGIEIAGQIPVVLADFGLTAPDLGFVTVEPAGTIEILLRLIR